MNNRGLIPTRLSELCKIVAGYAFPSSAMSAEPSKYQVVKMGNLYGGYLDLDRSKSFVDTIDQGGEKFLIKHDDILLTLTGTVGKRDFGYSFRVCNPNNLLLNQRLCLLRANPDKVDPVFLSNILKHSMFLDQFFAEAIGGTGNQANVSIKQLSEMIVRVPPLSEQRKIAEILRTWDEAIEKLEVLCEAKEHQLEGFAAHLIHKSQADPQYLREHLNEVSKRNSGQCVDRVLSVTNSSGFVLAEDQFAHRVASADISNYKIVRRGHYAYNPSRINVGSIARLDDWEEGALSPMYVVFETRKGLDSDYFLHWLRSAEARQRIALSAQGSVRETVSFGDFSSILIPIPPVEDQRQIAQALNLARDEIALINREITTLQRQKRGLMQKLLTGEWRVALSQDQTENIGKEAAHG